MKPVHQVLFAAGLLILGATTWRILTRPKPPADWLQVEAPAQAAPGEIITVRIRLTKPRAHQLICTDLHGWTRALHPLRAISESNAQPLDPSVLTYDFRLHVPMLPDLAEVRAVIYLSPTGRWQDQVGAVTSDAIPIRAMSGPGPGPTLSPLEVHDQVPDPAVPRIESTVLRGMILSLWLMLTAVLLSQVLAGRRAQSAAPQPSGRRPHPALIFACLAAALVELFHLEPLVSDAARQFALRHGLYDERQLPQQVAVLGTVVGVAALAGIILIRARRRRLVLGLLLYAAIVIVAILSLHEVDTLLYATFLGLPLEQLAKLIAVAVSLWGLRSPLSPA